ncbi:I78 family peptidase inhibitor [Pseudomonas sp. GX19020]|uniref:I78 family peptidase inhibitor n=1 Tax=Pseudomonadota TaxID=1224 RepID=UPI00089BD9B0|nr:MULTISPECIES: I78 family peptidase inhibitor [Pseudomonadota]MCL4066629.1 I78 family peptidase inhibitor [Pseudomonas sp. GX19020]SEB41849.1 Peptidase inhibitor I78 family protein [Rhodobacter sp. 24-YEA-8]
MTLLRLTLLPLCAGLALSACVPAPPADIAPSLPEPANDTCGARAVGHLIGQDQAVLASLAGRRDPMRVISPGQAVTMDYISTRLNVQLDAAGKITAMHCA